MRFGARRSGWGPERLDRRERRPARTEVVWPGPAVLGTYVVLRVACWRAGHALAQPEQDADRWNAATAVHLGIPLVSHDRIFSAAPGLLFETAVPQSQGDTPAGSRRVRQLSLLPQGPLPRRPPAGGPSGPSEPRATRSEEVANSLPAPSGRPSRAGSTFRPHRCGRSRPPRARRETRVILRQWRRAAVRLQAAKQQQFTRWAARWRLVGRSWSDRLCSLGPSGVRSLTRRLLARAVRPPRQGR